MCHTSPTSNRPFWQGTSIRQTSHTMKKLSLLGLILTLIVVVCTGATITPATVWLTFDPGTTLDQVETWALTVPDSNITLHVDLVMDQHVCNCYAFGAEPGRDYKKTLKRDTNTSSPILNIP